MRRSTRSKTAARAHEGDFASANPHSSLSVLENAGTTTTGGVGRKQRRMTEENDGKGGEEKEDEKNESRRSPTIVVGSKPREVAEEEKESTKKETKNASSKCTEEEQKLRILLVEDDIPTSLIITSMLTQAGAVVTNASNGKQAVERLRDNKYHEKIDLILTDMGEKVECKNNRTIFFPGHYKHEITEVNMKKEWDEMKETLDEDVCYGRFSIANFFY